MIPPQNSPGYQNNHIQKTGYGAADDSVIKNFLTCFQESCSCLLWQASARTPIEKRI
jgi:hypothetical protein